MTNAAAPEPLKLGPYETNVTASYAKLNVLYLGKKAVKEASVPLGPIRVRIEGDDVFEVNGNLNAGGGVSGMAKLHARLQLHEGSTLKFFILRRGDDVTVSVVDPAGAKAPETAAPAPGAASTKAETLNSVFERKKLKHVHLEVFRPENLGTWAPEAEVDVYLAFGVLQEHTSYRYCCGVSAELLRRLGMQDDATKPDAVLIDVRSDEYVLAEWKMKSSAFKSNHKKEDVDVLVCWEHDETSLETLPREVVCLEDVAREAAALKFAPE